MTEWYQLLKDFFGTDPFFLALEYLGTFAAAISGIRLASIKHFDWFGAYVVGFVTALGGGTIRDVMLGVRPFWMAHEGYFYCTMVAVISVWLFGRHVIGERVTWFIFDTIGLAAFTVIGIQKTELVLGSEGSWWLAIVMGTITGAAGGVGRDILINVVPLIFRKEIYALACIIGGVGYYGLKYFTGLHAHWCATVCMVVVFVIRFVAIKYQLGLPVLRGRPKRW